MGFDVGNSVQTDARRRRRVLDNPSLRRHARRRDTVRGADMARRGAQDFPVHAVTALTRQVFPAQQHDGYAFAGHIAVCVAIEGAAGPGRAEHAGLAERDIMPGVDDQADAGHHGVVTFAQQQRASCLVQRGQRSGAGGVERVAFATPTEDIGHPVGQDSDIIPKT